MAIKKMKLSSNGLKLIMSFEGLRLEAYKCVATEKYYTIGYGHYGPDVKPDQKITKAEAKTLLKSDCQRFVDHVNTYLSKYPSINQNQFDALVSFAYNIGNINQLTANGTRSLTILPTKMLLYNKSGGKVLPGLTLRRQKEAALFNTPVK